MKKILPVLVILLILGVGGYFYMNSKGAIPKAPIGTASNNTASTNVFNSIKDALSKSLSLKCVYKDERGVQTTTYIKGGAVRVSMVEDKDNKEQPNAVILKDKKMYMWNETTKAGFTYTLTEPKISPSKETGVTPEVAANKDASVLAEIEKYKDSCKTEVIADSFFVPPTDVKFQDMSAFTENLMKQIPTTGPDKEAQQKAFEELMKQITPGADNGQ
ncbi:MAG: hypothetical protein WC744_03445 [Patescibacteria group bacterium]